MQTFLPYPSFRDSFACLDYKRLGKQRVECSQILTILETKKTSGAWVNHPAVKMWRGYEDSLRLYLLECILEWTQRGYRNNIPLPIVPEVILDPFWLGDDFFHASHRSNGPIFGNTMRHMLIGSNVCSQTMS